jgi:hypothetical protein
MLLNLLVMWLIFIVVPTLTTYVAIILSEYISKKVR